jgi:hypothetical protein
MATPRGTGDSGSSAGHEGDFDELLISGNFSEENCREYPLTTCISWLRLREHEVSMWERDFRLHQSELHNTLVDIRKRLTDLYKKMDRLCEGERCYLVLMLRTVPAAVQGYYNEFLAAHDTIGDALRAYIAYARHYELKYAKGELPARQPQGHRPEDMRKSLFDSFALLKTALRNLVEALADPAVQPAVPGQDTPDGPERRSA